MDRIWTNLELCFNMVSWDRIGIPSGDFVAYLWNCLFVDDDLRKDGRPCEIANGFFVHLWPFLDVQIMIDHHIVVFFSNSFETMWEWVI